MKTVKLDWQSVVRNLKQLLNQCALSSQLTLSPIPPPPLPSFSKNEHRHHTTNMPSCFTEDDDKDYVSLKKPGCVASWDQGTDIIETFYEPTTSTTTTTISVPEAIPEGCVHVTTPTRRTELKSASVNLQQAICRQNIAVEHHILQHVMRGDKKMFKANKYAVQEYKRKSSIESMSGKENSPLPALARELIAATKDLQPDPRAISSNADSIITVHVIVIGNSDGGALQQRHSFDVHISAHSIGARLMDHCLSELKSAPPNARAKLSFDEKGVMTIHRDHKLVDQGVRHNDHVFVQIDAHYDDREWIDILYTSPSSSGNETIAETAASTLEGMHFVKVYNGEAKVECAKAESDFFNALKEEEARFKCECPCLVRPLLTILDKSTHFAVSITPLFQEGDAFDIFTDARHIPFSTHIALWNDLGAGALRHLYLLGFQHGDVKLENVMYNGRFHLTDCEFAGKPGLDLKRSSGTPNYSSPERFSFPPLQDAKCDGWSFALTIIAAWCQRLLQVTSLDAKQESERCRVHIETCSVCRVALVLDSSGQNACVCRALAARNQPLIKRAIEKMMTACFERFALEMRGEGSLDACFPNIIGGATAAREIIVGTLNGLLTIEHESRYGPDMVRALN